MGRLENFVVKGGIKVPIGFRFCPTDEELLLYYLKKKAFAQQLPASVISEFDVFQTKPWRLPGDLTENRYFFSNVNGVMSGNIKKRPAGSGSWKSVGKEKQILRSESNELIGMKKTLIFCRGSYQTRTRWVMHQLRLVTSTYPCQIPVADFAVYRIFQKKKIETKMSHQKASSSSKLQRPDDVKASIIDFTVEFGHDNIGHPPPSSPCLSEGCGEISSSKLD